MVEEENIFLKLVVHSIKPRKNYHSGQIKCVQHLYCSFISVIAEKSTSLAGAPTN